MRRFVFFLLSAFIVLAIAPIATYRPAIAQSGGDDSFDPLWGHAEEGLYSAAFTPDGQFVMVDDKIFEAATGKLVKTYARDNIGMLAFSADGSTAAAILANQGVVLLRLPSFNEIANYFLSGTSFEERNSTAAALNPDGSVLVGALENGLTFFEPRSGTVLRELREYSSSDVSFSADGKYLYVARSNNASDSLRILNYPDLTPVPVDETLRQALSRESTANGLRRTQQLTLSPDGSLMALAFRDSGDTRVILIFQMKDGLPQGDPLHTLRVRNGGDIGSVAFSPDNRLLAAAFNSGREDTHAHLFNLQTGEEQLFRPTRPQWGVQSVDFSADGSLFLYQTEGDLYVLKRRGGPMAVAQPPTTGGSGGSGEPATPTVITVANSPDLTPAALLETEPIREKVAFVAVSPDSKLAITSLAAFDLTTKEKISGFGTTNKGAEPIRVAFSPDGSQIVTLSLDQRLQLWKPDGKSASARIRLDPERNRPAVAYAPTGEILVASASGITRHDPKTGRISGNTPFNFPKPKEIGAGARMGAAQPRAVSFSADGSLVAVAEEYFEAGGRPSSAVIARVVRTADGTLQASVVLPEWVMANLALSPNGKVLAISGADAKQQGVSLHNAQSGERIGFVDAPINLTPGALAFSPDGSLIVVDLSVGTGDGRFGIFGTDGKAGTSKSMPIGPTVNAAFTPDGRSLITVNEAVGITGSAVTFWTFGGTPPTGGSGGGAAAQPTLAPAPDTNEVIFIVTAPDSTPTDASLYVAGNFKTPGLPEWEPAGLKMTPVQGRPYQWRLTLFVKAGAVIEFKFTRGSWETVEKGPACEEIADRVLETSSRLGFVSEVEVSIDKWRDRDCGGN